MTTLGSPELGLLAERIAQLEKQNRLFKRWGILLLVLVGGVALVAAQGRERTVEAEHFLLKDANGRVRADLGLDKKRTCGFAAQRRKRKGPLECIGAFRRLGNAGDCHVRRKRRDSLRLDPIQPRARLRVQRRESETARLDAAFQGGTGAERVHGRKKKWIDCSSLTRSPMAPLWTCSKSANNLSSPCSAPSGVNGPCSDLRQRRTSSSCHGAKNRKGPANRVERRKRSAVV